MKELSSSVTRAPNAKFQLFIEQLPEGNVMELETTVVCNSLIT